MKHSTGCSLTLMAMTMALPALVVSLARPAMAADTTVTMHKATQEGPGESVGTIVISSAADGVSLKLDLHGLPPGPHGFHVHENGSCGPTMMNGTRIPGGAAGGHFDPDHANKHEGPAGAGHMGDLPLLTAEPDGTATQTLTAPRIKDISVLKGHALMIHQGGDNYADTPSPLGGGGGRFACGVVE